MISLLLLVAVLLRPLLWLIRLLLFFLSPFISVSLLLLKPAITLACFVYAVVTAAPDAMLSAFDAIEPLYIYLGIAGLLGIATGGVLHIADGFVCRILGLDTGGDAYYKDQQESTSTVRQSQKVKRPQTGRQQRRRYLDRPKTAVHGLALDLNASGIQAWSGRGTGEHGRATSYGTKGRHQRLPMHSVVSTMESPSAARRRKHGVLGETIFEEED